MLIKTSYQTPVTPRAEQTAALAAMRGKPAFALLMAMRTGKTKVVLDNFGAGELTGAVKCLMVIAPGGVYKTWEKAWKEHVSADLQSRAKLHVWQSSSSGSKHAKALKAWLLHTGPRVLLMNVEALSKIGAARTLCERVLQAQPTLLAIDESTAIKNPKAKRAKYICYKLRTMARVRRILSGLPTPRSPLDLFMQFYFLDPNILGHKSYYTFRNRYAIVEPQWFRKRKVNIVMGYINQEELQAKIAPYSYRVAFRPKIPSTYSIEDVELTPEQKRAYNDMLNYSTTMLANESHVTATVVIAQIMKLHQILMGHVKDERGVLHSIPEKRTGKLCDVLDRGGGKAVIWCSYDYSIRKVSERLIEEFGAPSVAKFWGGNVKTREDEEHRFLHDDNCQFMLATPDAGGKGRTWDVADLVVYYSSTNDLEKRDQSEQRVQGVEKTRQVDYIDLIAPNTVEMHILKALRNKIDMASVITGDNYREWLL